MSRREEVKKELIAFKMPRYHELPDFDIYMDQVINYMNSHFDTLYFNDEKVITSSMINNYVKNSIVKAPTKKLYTRVHLAFIIVVVILKRCYSLNEIQTLINIYRGTNTSIEDVYDKFSSTFEHNLQSIIKNNKVLSTENKNVSWQQILLENTVQSVILKISAEIAMIPDEEKGTI